MAFSPNGLFAYALTVSRGNSENYGVQVLRRDPATGDVVPLGTTGGCLDGRSARSTCALYKPLRYMIGNSVAVGPNGRNLYISGSDSRNAAIHVRVPLDRATGGMAVGGATCVKGLATGLDYNGEPAEPAGLGIHRDGYTNNEHAPLKATRGVPCRVVRRPLGYYLLVAPGGRHLYNVGVLGAWQTIVTLRP